MVGIRDYSHRVPAARITNRYFGVLAPVGDFLVGVPLPGRPVANAVGEFLGQQITRRHHHLRAIRHHTRSTTIATALPPPRHRAASPRRALRSCMAYRSVTSTRAPDAPIGCPSATAPP